jgi:hypothetical protein
MRMCSNCSELAVGEDWLCQRCGYNQMEAMKSKGRTMVASAALPVSRSTVERWNSFYRAYAKWMKRPASDRALELLAADLDSPLAEVEEMVKTVREMESESDPGSSS